MAVCRTFLKFCSVPNSHYSLQAPTPDPARNVKKVANRPLLSAAGYNTWLDRQHTPLKTYHSTFFKGRETHWGYSTAFISDEYERANLQNCAVVFFFLAKRCWFGAVSSKAWSTTHRIRSLSTRRPSNEGLICVHLFPDLHTGENILGKLGGANGSDVFAVKRAWKPHYQHHHSCCFIRKKGETYPLKVFKINWSRRLHSKYFSQSERQRRHASTVLLEGKR